ncbi:MAG: WcbI family polysaccharide biosynthesis putative acetyltransferase [Synechococcaceae cyanobacterium]|jgi:hypothetical protein
MSTDPQQLQSAADLLALAAEAQRGPANPASLQALALACHGRMLAIVDSDKRLAVRHAIAGAALLADLTDLGADQPEWLAVHEEQCCRYGCVWIHELLQAGDRQAYLWLEDALRLLARMEQLHAQPLDWAPMLRANLQQASADPLAIPLDDRRIVLVGDGVCHGLQQGLQRALPQARIHVCPSPRLATPDELVLLRQRLASADLLITQLPQPADLPDRDGQLTGLRNLLPATAHWLVLPEFQFNGHHPFIGEALDPQSRLKSLEQPSPLGRYHDFLAMVAAARGISEQQLLQPVSSEQRAQIRQLFRRALDELEQRERQSEIRIAGWMEQQHRLQPVAQTNREPSQACLEAILLRVLSRIEASIPKAQPRDPVAAASALSIPIHPWVRQALDLGDWASSSGWRRGEPLTIEQQLADAIHFYRQHPRIGQANSLHPTYLAAEQCLSQAHDVVHPTISPAQIPSARHPSLAALINYHDDEEMLAWQLHAGCLDPYDHLYLWDGPYQTRSQLDFSASQPRFLSETTLGEQLLKDPRVVYRQGQWNDEGAKRIEAYEAIREDLIVLHDTDEFFQLDRRGIEQFWQSGYGVASHRTQNLYVGGLLGSDAYHRSNSPASLPCKRILFRRRAIPAAQHLDHLWLVGVPQQPADESQLFPQPIGDTLHLTGCRSTRGQIAKMRFYKSLALSQRSPDPVVAQLQQLIDSRQVSAEEALLIYLQGDFGFTGTPYPDSGLSLQPHFPVCLSAETLNQILAQSHQLSTGDYKLLEGYPLALWIAPGAISRRLRISTASVQSFELRSWLWFERQPAIESLGFHSQAAQFEISLPGHPALMGVQLQIHVQPSGPAPRWLSLRVDAV